MCATCVAHTEHFPVAFWDPNISFLALGEQLHVKPEYKRAIGKCRGETEAACLATARQPVRAAKGW